MILSLFTEAINSESNDLNIQYSQTENEGDKDTIEIKTIHNSFGYFHLRGNLSSLSNNAITLIRNSINMLAVILENRFQASLLAKDKERLEILVNEQTKVLRTEKEFTETALNAQQDTFFLFEPATGKAIRWNRAFNNITGYKNEEIAGMKAPDSYYSPEDLKRTAKFIDNVMDKGAGMIELELICKDGRKVPTEYSSSIIRDDKGNVKYFISIGRDITERKKNEEEKTILVSQLHQSQKMEAMGTLAGGIAHDFNNILFPISGYVEILMEDLPQDTPSQEYLRRISTGVGRATELVKQILMFGRQTKGERTAVKIQTVLKEVVKLSKASIPSTIKIESDIDNNCGHVMADPTQIHQVAMNLITNAYQAIEPDSGTLGINLEQIDLTHENMQTLQLSPGTYICLTVADTGIGMDSNMIDKIFNPYFTTKKKGKGTGLGLSVVHGIVKSYGGDIHIKSYPGKKTSFKVYFPRVENMQKINEDTVDVILPRGTERILIVDDEMPIVMMLEEMLKRLGYKVTSESGSLKALDVFKSRPESFDLVISDMTMPDMTGTQLINGLRKIRKNIPVIIFTGYLETINENQAKAAGINAFLMKPINKTDMALTIRKVLGKG